MVKNIKLKEIRMINLVKKIRKIEKCNVILNYANCIQGIKKGEALKYSIRLDNDYKLYSKLETIIYKIAIKKATTTEEIEECAVSVEENYTGELDPDDWAEQIRIKAYGIEWYLKRQFNTPSYQEFVSFTNEMEIENPFEELSHVFLEKD